MYHKVRSTDPHFYYLNNSGDGATHLNKGLSVGFSINGNSPNGLF